MPLIYLILLGVVLPFLLLILHHLRKCADRKILIKKEGKELPTILYLRSFNTDGENDIVSQPSIVTPLASLMDYKIGLAHEYNLAKQLTNFAHLVAVGKSDEDLPDAVFKRLYFSDTEWKEEVVKLIAKSNVIIYRPNLTAPLFWEMDQIIKQNATNKLVIWNLAGDEQKEFLRKAIYNAFREKIESIYKIHLPEYSKKNRFIFFNDHGEIDSTDYVRFELRNDKSVRIFK